MQCKINQTDAQRTASVSKQIFSLLLRKLVTNLIVELGLGNRTRRRLREFILLGVYYAEYPTHRDGSSRRIKALFWKEEALENYCLIWDFFVQPGAISYVVAVCLPGLVKVTVLALGVRFLSRLDHPPAVLLKWRLERHEQIKGAVKSKAVISPLRQLKHHKQSREDLLRVQTLVPLNNLFLVSVTTRIQGLALIKVLLNGMLLLITVLMGLFFFIAVPFIPYVCFAFYRLI